MTTSSCSRELEREISTRQPSRPTPGCTPKSEAPKTVARFEQLLVDLDLSPETLQETLRIALGLGSAQEPLGRARRTGSHATAVAPAIALAGRGGRQPAAASEQGRHRSDALAGLRQPALHPHDQRPPVFRPSMDTVLLHLGHPVMRQALASFARLRFPGGQSEFTPPSRWVVTRGAVPQGADALLLLTVEEMAVNELRETFHHWVRTVVLACQGRGAGRGRGLRRAARRCRSRD
jgi:hypothetical protein